MRRRLMLGWTPLVMGLVLMLPASSLAGNDFVFTTVKDVCQKPAGAYGYGHNVLTVKVKRSAGQAPSTSLSTPRSSMTIRAAGRLEVGPRLVGRPRWSFPNDGDSYWYKKSYSYDPRHLAWHRIVVTVKVWHVGLLSSTLKAKHSFDGTYC